MAFVNDTTSVNGKLEWISECYFKLKSVAVKRDTSDFGKALIGSFGEPLWEIKESKGDSIFFRSTWSGNLRVTIDEGYFLKLK